MSVFSYNGVTFPYAAAVRFGQDVVYDDQSQTDWYCNKFDIQVNSIIHAAYLSDIAPDLVQGGNPLTNNAAEIMKIIRTRLMKPRRTLSYKFNGAELLPTAAEVPGTVDAQNGPQPQSCEIIQLNIQTFLIRYHIIAHYWENNDVDGTTVTNLAGNPILFNRWSETADIDNRGFTIRTRQGKFVIRSDNDLGALADMLRSEMAVIGLPNETDWQRASTQYTVDPSGLALQYRIVDKEVWRQPPYPAYEAEGEYTETSTHNGAKIFGAARIRLVGSKFSDQAEMIQVAGEAVVGKLNARGFELPGGLGMGPVNSRIIRVGLYDNWIECYMDGMYKIDDRIRKQQVAARQQFKMNNLVRAPIGSEPGTRAPIYFDRGSAGILLQAAAYWDPSLLGIQLTPEGQMPGNVVEPGRAGVEPEA